jgi:preprotein translocase subunit YajC
MGNNVILAATASKSSGGSYLFLVAIVVLFGLLYFVTIRPQRNRQRQAQQTQREIVPGTRVRTTAGMYATVKAVQDQDVILELAPGVEVRFLRRAIMDVVPDPSGMGAPGPSPDGSSDPREDSSSDPRTS